MCKFSCKFINSLNFYRVWKCFSSLTFYCSGNYGSKQRNIYNLKWKLVKFCYQLYIFFQSKREFKHNPSIKQPCSSRQYQWSAETKKRSLRKSETKKTLFLFVYLSVYLSSTTPNHKKTNKQNNFKRLQMFRQWLRSFFKKRESKEQ